MANDEKLESVLRLLGYPEMQTNRQGQGILPGTNTQQPERIRKAKIRLENKNTSWKNRADDTVEEKTPPLPFEEPSHPSVTPSDPDMHYLRKNNPALNDYQFRVIDGGLRRGGSEILALHHGHPGAVAHLKWEEPMNSWDGDAPIKMVQTDEGHRGKGLATAMWDYAHLSDRLTIKPRHSHDRSNAGDGWANYVSKRPTERTRGFEVEEY